ncbi:MAG: hypothetical protein D6752_02245 [Candidatus Nitrosothermus koennekii]|nr:MAG: hypothetical protein D6752_02245 [Candidatus Nitrosothermus koennekii]
MSKFICPKCKTEFNIFRHGGGRELANMFDIELLGEVPIDPEIANACDNGTPFVKNFQQSATAKILENITNKLQHIVE